LFTKKFLAFKNDFEFQVTTFVEIQTESMENTAQTCFKKLAKLQREAKDKDNWTIVNTAKEDINRFKRTMPLITDLKNPAMRDRHWFDIKEGVGPFEHETEDFTLEKIIELKLEEHGEKVSEVSGAASKELAIEQALSALEETWGEIELEIGPYKDRGHFILKARVRENDYLRFIFG
jgi:dynein heavy chain